MFFLHAGLDLLSESVNEIIAGKPHPQNRAVNNIVPRKRSYLLHMQCADDQQGIARADFKMINVIGRKQPPPPLLPSMEEQYRRTARLEYSRGGRGFWVREFGSLSEGLGVSGLVTHSLPALPCRVVVRRGGGRELPTPS